MHADSYKPDAQVRRLTCFKNGSYLVHYGAKVAAVLRTIDRDGKTATRRLTYETKAEANGVFWYRDRLFATFQERIFAYSAVLDTD